MSGPLGPSGTEAVVKVGSLARYDTLASAVTWERSTGCSMSRTSWNSPLWWSISSITASSGSIIHLLPAAMVGILLGENAIRLRPAAPCGGSDTERHKHRSLAAAVLERAC